MQRDWHFSIRLMTGKRVFDIMHANTRSDQDLLD
jgi:hypothetical protein